MGLGAFAAPRTSRWTSSRVATWSSTVPGAECEPKGDSVAENRFSDGFSDSTSSDEFQKKGFGCLLCAAEALIPKGAASTIPAGFLWSISTTVLIAAGLVMTSAVEPSLASSC